MIDSEFLQKGGDYSEMPEVRIIYISETDIWRKGKTTYRVRKAFEDTDITYEDGIHLTYVNAAVDDGSEIARLMEYFKTADPDDMSQGALSRRVHFLKCEEGILQQAQVTAGNLARMGFPLKKIAQAVEVDAALVKKRIANP